MEACVSSGENVIHRCGDPRIHVFDNVVQCDPYIVGKKNPVKALIYPCQENILEEARRDAKLAAEHFKKMIQG